MTQLVLCTRKFCNKINHVYHLSIIVNKLNLNLKLIDNVLNLELAMDVWQEFFQKLIRT